VSQRHHQRRRAPRRDHLPAGVPGVLPQRIVQDIVLADGAARTGSAAAALGNAFIGQNGNVAALQDLLAASSRAP
jgi:hypothetical protein